VRAPACCCCSESLCVLNAVPFRSRWMRMF
jgi:hypothetical protein